MLQVLLWCSLQPTHKTLLTIAATKFIFMETLKGFWVLDLRQPPSSSVLSAALKRNMRVSISGEVSAVSRVQLPDDGWYQDQNPASHVPPAPLNWDTREKGPIPQAEQDLVCFKYFILDSSHNLIWR